MHSKQSSQLGKQFIISQDTVLCLLGLLLQKPSTKRSLVTVFLLIFIFIPIASYQFWLTYIIYSSNINVDTVKPTGNITVKSKQQYIYPGYQIIDTYDENEKIFAFILVKDTPNSPGAYSKFLDYLMAMDCDILPSVEKIYHEYKKRSEK